MIYDLRLTSPELGHDRIPLLLRHISVHAADGKVGFTELLGQPVDLSTGVAEDDGLGDGEAKGKQSTEVSEVRRAGEGNRRLTYHRDRTRFRP